MRNAIVKDVGKDADGDVPAFRKGKLPVLVLVFILLVTNLFSFQVSANGSDFGVTAVQAVSLTSIEVTMPEVTTPVDGLAAGNFTITGGTAPVTVTNASYAAGKYTLTLGGSGINYYDTYTLTIFDGVHNTYPTDLYYGTPIAAENLNFDNEPNMFNTYTRNYGEGTVRIVNNEYTANAQVCTGTAMYTAIDTTNGLATPAAAGDYKVVGTFVVPPDGAKGVKSLFADGTMTQLGEDSLIDKKPMIIGGKTYYLETVASGREAYGNGNGTDPSNHDWETIKFAPVYMKTAVKDDSTTWRLNDPNDRLRILEWYRDTECTELMRVDRFMMTVEYIGDVTKEYMDNGVMKREVIAHDTADLEQYIADPNVPRIDLVNGATYQCTGSAISRDLTINGNGAVILAGTGVLGDVIRSDNVTVNSSGLANYPEKQSFLTVGTGSHLTLQNLTLQNGVNKNGTDNSADGLFDVVNVTSGGSLSMTQVTLNGFHNNPEHLNGQGQTVGGDNINFGIHAEPGAVAVTIQNCHFDSSNAFRNAIAIRSGAFQIDHNTFEGTDFPIRLKQSDGYEYAMYIYGGNGTVSDNTATGYDSTTQPGYASAGIAVIGFYSTDIVIRNNNLNYNASGIDITRTWSPWSSNTFMRVNGIQLTASAIASESAIAYEMGESLKASNSQEYVSVSMDQNDEVELFDGNHRQYFAVYGGYRSPMLSASRVSETGVVLQIPSTEGDGLRAADSIVFEQQVDGSSVWMPLNVNWLDNPTKAAISLSTGHTYKIRMKMTHTSYVEASDLIARTLVTYTNPVTLAMTPTPVAPVQSVPTPSNNVVVLVNGKAESAGTATTTVESGKTVVTIEVDPQKLAQKLESEGENAVVTIRSALPNDVLVGKLTGDMVKQMESKQGMLELQTATAGYRLPMGQVNIADVLKRLGNQAELKDISLQVRIAEPPAETIKVVEDSAGTGNFTLIAPPVDFTVTGVYKDRTVSITSYSAYVERTIAIPEGVDPSKITTGIIVEPDGTVRHVPTQIVVINGKYFAKINSLSNSTYSVVWHPIEYSDVSGHWAKEAVNDMGSRMIAVGSGNGRFEPDKDITRAEFTVMLVKALGLKPGTGEQPFADVKPSEPYAPYIEAAVSYGIINGFGDGTFGPGISISREQAMAMIGRAMTITKLEAGLNGTEAEQLLAGFTDGTQTSAWARNSVAACLKTQILVGKAVGQLAPVEALTRAEAAVLVRRLLQQSKLI